MSKPFGQMTPEERRLANMGNDLARIRDDLNAMSCRIEELQLPLLAHYLWAAKNEVELYISVVAPEED